MTDPTNDTDIDALLKAIDPNKGNRPRWDNWETVIFAAACTRYHRAITALVAERDKAKADFVDAWRERSEFAMRIDEADAALAAALQALRKAHDAMVLAKTSHGCILACDPPLDAWKYRCVDAHLGDAIRDCAAAMRKGEQNAE